MDERRYSRRRVNGLLAGAAIPLLTGACRGGTPAPTISQDAATSDAAASGAATSTSSSTAPTPLIVRETVVPTATPQANAQPAQASRARTARPAAQTKRVPVSPEEIVRGPANRPYVSLIINAGAGYEPAPEILDVLASRGVITSFFLMGWWAERNPELLLKIANGGHEIASHGHSIFDVTQASDAAIANDLESADAVISGITGYTTRPLWSASAGYRNARVHNIAARLGYRPIFWTYDSGDWTPTATAQSVYRAAMRGAEPGAIIVFHFESSTTRTSTAVALGDIIDGMRAQGLEPVTITELVGE